MKKYYAYFIDGNTDKEFVIRFKVKGSLRYREDRLYRCFMDDKYYVRTIEDLVKMVLSNNGWNLKVRCVLLLDHELFTEYRAHDIPRVALDNEVIEWD